MNLNLYDYTPSKELTDIQRFHYSQARRYIEKNGADKDKLFNKLKTEIESKIPQKVLETEEAVKQIRDIYDAVDLAFIDYETKQKDKNEWTRA